MENKAVFLDRDGTINVDKSYAYKKDDLAFLPNAVLGLKKMQEKGYLLIIVTNQSGIGRGYYSEREYQEFMKEFYRQLKEQGIKITADYHCGHKEEDKCNCRKPNTELVETAIKEHNIDREKSFFIGDKKTDVITGKRCKLKTISLSDEKEADFVCKDLMEASIIIP
jgi:histidinol-phosphate phosphatase family protein